MSDSDYTLSAGIGHDGKPEFGFSSAEDDLPLPYQPFPVSCLPKIAADFVSQGATAMDADASMVALPLLACIASCIGSAVRLIVNPTWIAPAILWTCVVGKSGSAKSPAAGLSIDLVKEIADGFAAEHFESTKNWSADGCEGEEPKERRIITTNGTLPGLASLQQENQKGLLYYADELAGWMKDQGRYSNNKADESDAWNELYEGKTFWHDRKVAKSLKVRFSNVCVTGGIQPARLFRIFDQDNLDSGLAARILFAQPPHRIRKLNEGVFDDGVRSAMKSRLTDLLQLKTDYGSPTWKPCLIGMAAGAFQMFQKFHDTLQERVAVVDGALNAALSKLAGVAVRLALTLQLFCDPESTCVTPSTMSDAIELTKWFANESDRLYTGQQFSPENALAAMIIDVLSAFPMSSIRMIQHRKRALRPPNFTADVIESQMMRLKRGGLVDCENLKTGGRDQTVWFLVNGADHIIWEC